MKSAPMIPRVPAARKAPCVSSGNCGVSGAWLVLGVLVASLFGVLGCGEDSKGEPVTDTVYYRLGEEAGVRTVARSFLAALYGNPRINGYFLNSALDGERLESCVVKQIGSATGGPQVYDCRGMKEAHAGLHISQQDFDDFVSTLSATLVAAEVPEADIDTITGALAPMAEDIVEDRSSDATLYQKLGRKPAIAAVVQDFVGRVAGDVRINAFFARTNNKRITQCLVRQVCQATGGPCVYGKEALDRDFPTDEDDIQSPCRDMKKTHASLGISKADFGALVEDLVQALDAAGVPADMKETILSVLGPLCPDIVEKDTCG
jgi:hemoglobin